MLNDDCHRFSSKFLQKRAWVGTRNCAESENKWAEPWREKINGNIFSALKGNISFVNFYMKAAAH